MRKKPHTNIARWKADRVAFITEALVNPETGKLWLS